jgi:hypothetical protein
MGDIVYSAAFPKSGVTYLDFMLFYALFDPPYELDRVESDYVIDVHAFPENVPAPGVGRCYVKTHSPFGPSLPLRSRADRAICLVRDPIDVMMSLWDYMHLTGSEALLNAPETLKQKMFRDFVGHWVVSGGDPLPFAQIDISGSWIHNVSSWLDQRAIPTLFVRYEDLKAEPVAQLSRVFGFLEKPIARERLEAAASKGSVSQMRQQEQHEIDSKPARPGAFYRPELAKAYDKGFRFVGKLHSGARDTVLSELQRRNAERVFGSALARVDARIA